MASPFQQRSLQRKFVYFGLVLALLTGSLLFRRLVINASAEQLRLRSVDQGEVALTDTAMNLTLGGLRGVAVTYLWQTAIEHQKRHEWSELEGAVRSLTQLQPHYISPWLFQSWNLAFNVSVECDRSRDKYFYISRGIQLLAEGERKNRGNEHPDPKLRSPANPEMRYNIGFFYQLKIGQGDESRTLRSLFDLSCIDPTQRRDLIQKASELARKKGDVSALRKELAGKFRAFCEAHPRVVRRLHDRLGMTEARDIINFLVDNQDLPSRFAKPDADGTARLLPAEDQFPILPPYKSAHGSDWPRPDDANFGGIETDVFVVTRAWYEYAQEPLPPPSGKTGVIPEEVRGQSRLPKMDQYVFRFYPARAQAYEAEELEKEGWFGGEGWTLSGRFADLTDTGVDLEGSPVGKNLNARTAWDKARQLYQKFVQENGLVGPAEYEALEAQGRQKGENSKEAHDALWMAYALRLTNCYEFLEQALAEKEALTANARRKFYEAEQLHAVKNIRELAAYRAALDDWIDVTLAFPKFTQQSQVQEDIYEMELKYLRALQGDVLATQPIMEVLLKKFAQGAWPRGFVDELLKNKLRVPMKKILPTRRVSGPLELTYIFTGTSPVTFKAEADKLKEWTVSLTQAALWPPLPVGLTQPLFPPLPSPELRELRKLIKFNAQQDRRLLTARRWHNDPPGHGWEPVISSNSVRTVRDRLGLNPPLTAASMPPGAMPPGKRPPQPPR